MLQIECRIHPIFLPLIKLISKTLFVAPEKDLDNVERLIEEQNYSYAEQHIALIEKKWGVSTYTVKLSTRIDRNRILGK
jgi:hypothetical protein